VALAALIAAYHESGEPGHLRATLPLAGRTVIERQARLAAAAGAAPIILVVERMPAALSTAIERLRRDRIPVQVVRSAEEAAEAVDAYDHILLIGDGAIAGRSQLARLAAAEGAAVLTVPDGSHGELYERIDAGSRWAGIAAIDGALLRETAGMLRDWDLQSTLLRRTLQTGLAAASFYVHWYWIGLAKLLIATPLEGIARRLARLRMQDGIRQSWWAYLVQLFGAAAMVLLAYGLAAVQGWGMILLAFTTLAFLVALEVETEGRRVRGATFLAERKGMTWLMLPFAAFGYWQAGLAFLFAYAAASFFWAQREAHADRQAPED
jgi:hypothetical protein